MYHYNKTEVVNVDGVQPFMTNLSSSWEINYWISVTTTLCSTHNNLTMKT